MFKVFCLCLYVYATAAANVEASFTPHNFANCDTTKSMYHETCCGAEPSVPLIDKTFLHLDDWVSAVADGTPVELQAYNLSSLKEGGKHSGAKIVMAFRQTFGRNPTDNEYNDYYGQLDSGILNEFELDATLTQTDEFMSVTAGKDVQWKDSGALQAKNVFVTGASSGIGFATMIAMAWAGANVTGCARERFYYDEHLKSAKMNVSDHERYPVYFGPIDVPKHVLDRMEFVTCDVRNATNITEVIQHAAGQEQQIDIVVAAAGTYTQFDTSPLNTFPVHQPLENLCRARRTPKNCTENDMMTNFEGVVNTYNALIEPTHLKTSTFIMIASIAGLNALFPGGDAYAVTKAAVRMLPANLAGAFTMALFPNVQAMNIRIVSPDFISTDMVTITAKTHCSIDDTKSGRDYKTGKALVDQLDRTQIMQDYWNINTGVVKTPPYQNQGFSAFSKMGGCSSGTRKVAMFAAAAAFVLANDPSVASELVLTNRAADWAFNSIHANENFLLQGKASNTMLQAYLGMASTKPHAAYPDEKSRVWGTSVFPSMHESFGMVGGLNRYGMRTA